MAAAMEPEPEFEPEDKKATEASKPAQSAWPAAMTSLAARIEEVQVAESVQDRLESLRQAYVLVYDADTELECVYSMELKAGEQVEVVLAFDGESQAEKYANWLQEESGEPAPTLQALDLEALIVTSREADFRVAVVFEEDMQNAAANGDATDDSSARSEASRRDDVVQQLYSQFPAGMFAGMPRKNFNLPLTMVPDTLYAGKTSADYIDPEEDSVWVLVSDAGTGDAELYSMPFNGTVSVVCFREGKAAKRCASSFNSKGMGAIVPREMLLGQLLDMVSGDEMDVCLVDDASMYDEDDRKSPETDEADALLNLCDKDPASSLHYDGLSSSETRAMLTRLLQEVSDKSD